VNPIIYSLTVRPDNIFTHVKTLKTAPDFKLHKNCQDYYTRSQIAMTFFFFFSFNMVE